MGTLEVSERETNVCTTVLPKELPTHALRSIILKKAPKNQSRQEPL